MSGPNTNSPHQYQQHARPQAPQPTQQPHPGPTPVVFPTGPTAQTPATTPYGAPPQRSPHSPHTPVYPAPATGTMPGAHPSAHNPFTSGTPYQTTPYPTWGANSRPGYPMGPSTMDPRAARAPTVACKHTGAVVIGVIAGVMVLLLLVFFGIGTVVSSAGRAAHQTMDTDDYDQSALEDLRARGYEPEDYLNDDGTVKDQKVYRFSEADSYTQYKQLLEGKSSEYNSKSPDDAIKLLPELSDRGVEYYGAWLKYLLTAEQELEASGERTTTDPNEIDIYYNAQTTALNELEQKFLHGEDLGIHATLRDSEGNVRDLYTGAFDLKSSQPDIPTLTADWEQKIKAVPIAMGSDGTYLAAGEQLIASVGLSPTYDFKSVYDHCSGSTRLADETTLGAFCSATPNLIYINQNSRNWTYDVTGSYYPNAVKHELAHAMIYRICGTTAPALRVDHEALTNSYATLYFGAERDVLNSGAQNAPWYTMTDASDTAAQLVHDGHCSISAD
ncbi:hypothetical protein PG2019B_0465 [Bifidobacterium pseudolongum subsp. globosum]|nr:hypothetical protein PG2019B_0465 [Bifidobacterium pseudolongum subsp. globosum]